MTEGEKLTTRLPEQWQRLVVDNLYLYAVFAIDLDGTLRSWNPGVKVVLGYDEADFVGQDATLFFTEEDRRAGIPELEFRRAREQGNANDVRWHLRADGSRFWASGAMTALRDDGGQLTGYAKVVRDSSKSKTLEASLEHLNENLETEVEARTADLRQLTFQLTLAEQQERRRLAQVLHDSVQQELFAIQFALTTLKKELEGRAALETLVNVETLVRKTVQLTRNVTTDLGPAVLEENDLRASLLWLADAMLARHGLRVKVVCESLYLVENEAVHTLLLNLTRELLFNIVKHAGVREAIVRVRADETTLALSVSDEGTGLTPALSETPSGTGLGLSGARRRLQLLGGTLDIVASPGQGTRITIILPTLTLTLP